MIEIDPENLISSSHSIVERTLTYQFVDFISSIVNYIITLSLIVILGHFALITILVLVEHLSLKLFIVLSF